MGLSVHVPGLEPGQPASVVIDGLDVAGCVAACEVRLHAGRPPQVELMIDPDDLAMALADPDVELDLASDHVAVLVAAGWTPPPHFQNGDDENKNAATK
jgi:hypothetical protein